MNQEQLLAGFETYLANLSVYDYLGLSAIFLLFTLLFVLAIALKKHWVLSFLLILIGFTLLAASPMLLNFGMRHSAKQADITIYQGKKLQYTQAVLIHGALTNNGVLDFKRCTVTAKIAKAATNPVLAFVHQAKPLRTQHLTIDQPIKKGETFPFRMIVENFTYAKPFRIVTYANCW